MSRIFKIAFALGLTTGLGSVTAQTPAPAAAPAAAPAPAVAGRGPRTPAPTRDPATPGYVAAKELADGTIPSAKADGNFILGPTHPPAPEWTAEDYKAALNSKFPNS